MTTSTTSNRDHTGTGPASKTGVDIIVSGLVTIRLIGAGPGDLAAVERQFGAPTAMGTEPADITIRYVERIGNADRTVRYTGPGYLGFTDDAFLVLRGRFRRQIRMRLPGDEIGTPCELLCEHGVGRVPLLVALVNLALLANGGVALHASAFELRGAATIATGWSKGGKTEALLAGISRGAAYIGDEWLHIGPDATVTGTYEPVRVWDWQLSQLAWLQPAVSRQVRLRLGTLGMVERAAVVAGASPRILDVLGRQRFVDLTPEVVAHAGRIDGPVPIGQILLMTATDQDRTWTRPLSGIEVADRMAASLDYERAPLAEVLQAYRYAFPKATTDAFDRAPTLERKRLRSLLEDVPAVEVLHPYPVDLHELGTAIWSALAEHR